MLNNNSIVIYVKYSSSHGIGSIPLGSEGKVLKYIKNALTAKLLVDFFSYGKAIVPLGSVKEK